MRATKSLGLAILVTLSACGGDDATPSTLSITKLIGPEGGFIELKDGGKVTIPPGALTTRAEIKVSKLALDDVAALPPNLEASGKPYAFEPHGFVFAAPIKISLPFDGDASQVRPVKLDDEKDTTWETVVGATKTPDSKLELSTTSFSVYLAARPRRGSGVITLPDGAIVTDGSVAGSGGSGGASGTGVSGTGGSGGVSGSGGSADASVVDADLMDASADVDATFAMDAADLDGAIVDASMTDAADASMADAGGLAWIGSQQAYMKASNTGAYDFFGQSVSVSADGNTMVVGAHHEASAATGIGGDQVDNSALDSGAVYVFARTGTLWTQQAYIKASNTDAMDIFGIVTSISGDGNTLAVGAWSEDGNATGINGDDTNDSASASGAVYVFTRTGTVWTQQAYIKASNTESNDGFSRAIALSGDGDTLAVGASAEASNATGINGNESDNSASISGAVYVFTRTGVDWSQEAYVKASNSNGNDGFGFAVGLSNDGDRMVVGAPNEASNATGVNANQSDNSMPQAGAAYAFTRAGTTWAQAAYLKASNTDQGDQFGSSVSISGDGTTIAVGAYQEDSAAVGVNGNQTSNAVSASGAVYLFARVGSTWTPQSYLKASNAEMSDQFGQALSLATDGNTLAVGAQLEDSNARTIDGNPSSNTAVNSGAVYVFTRVGSSWGQQSYVKANNADADDRFGATLSLSGDATTLAVGAYAERSNATGVNGSGSNNSAISSGAAYVFATPGNF